MKKGSPTLSDIKLFENLYDIHKSLRIVAKLTNWCPSTLKKYVTYRHKRTPIKKSKLVVDWRKRTKIKLVEYKGGKCVHCGYNECIEALQFHHSNPNKKDFTISGKSWSYERLKKEADKCILLCSNCHIKEHTKLNILGLT